MVKVNTKALKEMIDQLSELQNLHKEATLDLFKTVEHLSLFWQGDQAVLFFVKIREEKNNAEKIRNNLKKRENIYRYIYQEYSRFGQTIACDYESKDALIKKLDYGIEQLNLIVNRFNNLYTFFNFSQKEAVVAQRSTVTQVRNTWQSYRSKLNQFLIKVENIEAEVRRRIQALDEMEIKHFTIE